MFKNIKREGNQAIDELAKAARIKTLNYVNLLVSNYETTNFVSFSFNDVSLPKKWHTSIKMALKLQFFFYKLVI